MVEAGKNLDVSWISSSSQTPANSQEIPDDTNANEKGAKFPDLDIAIVEESVAVEGRGDDESVEMVLGDKVLLPDEEVVVDVERGNSSSCSSPIPMIDNIDHLREMLSKNVDFKYVISEQLFETAEFKLLMEEYKLSSMESTGGHSTPRSVPEDDEGLVGGGEEEGKNDWSLVISDDATDDRPGSATAVLEEEKAK